MLGCTLIGLQSAAAAAADPSSTTAPSARAAQPAAPHPTSAALSPDAPDPHPPAGGIGPDGRPVGGSQLASRRVVLPAHAPALPAGLTAAAWVLVDLDSGDVLAAKDPHGRYQPASILKTLTAVTLLPLLPGRKVVTASTAAADTEGSHAGLVAGGRYTVDDLFRGLLLVSGNDAAAALAQAAGGRQHTVELMNDTAARLGGYDTYVQTPSGLDGWQQLTSAYDMAIFLRAAVDQPRFVAYDRTLHSQLPWQQANGFGPVPLWNQNAEFLTTVPGALVAKTGYTDAAQHTFVGAISRHGRRLGVVFLRAQRWPADQWQQATDLVNWGFALPAGTPAVGHLDPATVPDAPAPSPTTHAQHVVVAALAATDTGRGGSGVIVPLGIAAALVATGGLAGWRINRARSSNR
jgi:serine-type D-Ala-D-Ala carboxypeptidase (penicillin-binding protein 5/6)